MARNKRWNTTKFDDGIEEIELSSWKYFYDFVHQEMLDLKSYIWRGHGSAAWDLTSTLERQLLKIPRSEWEKLTADHLINFQYAVRGRRGNNPPELIDDNSWWALGQHNGLSTPLLDWTSSPFVALYFAFCEPNPTPKGARAVYVLHRQTAERAGIELISPLTDENQRLVNQSGLFTRSPDDKKIIEALKEKYDDSDETNLLKVLIPNRERDKCLKTLERMNINHVTLFPDIYGACVHCNQALNIKNY